MDTKLAPHLVGHLLATGLLKGCDHLKDRGAWWVWVGGVGGRARSAGVRKTERSQAVQRAPEFHLWGRINGSVCFTLHMSNQPPAPPFLHIHCSRDPSAITHSAHVLAHRHVPICARQSQRFTTQAFRPTQSSQVPQMARQDLALPLRRRTDASSPVPVCHLDSNAKPYGLGCCPKGDVRPKFEARIGGCV